jgi:hypothetical protein
MQTASHLLDLGQRCNQLFNTSDSRLQQKLLSFLLYNVELYDKTLTYTVNDPYKTFTQLNKKASGEADLTNWCCGAYVVKIVDCLISSAVNLTDDYLLQELVADFQLEGGLLRV